MLSTHGKAEIVANVGSAPGRGRSKNFFFFFLNNNF